MEISVTVNGVKKTAVTLDGLAESHIKNVAIANSTPYGLYDYVFSGDTGPSENLVELASDADVLVHEAIDTDWVDQLLPPPRTPTAPSPCAARRRPGSIGLAAPF
mgnify:CR=1 FL=1